MVGVGILGKVVLNIYQTFCQAQKVDPLRVKSNFEKTQQYWMSQKRGKQMSLVQALEVCKKSYEMHPFIFNNGNAFAGFAKQMVEGWAKTLPSVEGQMLLTTVAHFVTGKISRKELSRILDFLAPSWERYQATLTTVVRPEPKQEPQPEAQPRLAPAGELIPCNLICHSERARSRALFL